MSGGQGPPPGDPLLLLREEARRRLPRAEVRCSRSGSAYQVEARRGGAAAAGKLKARFWEEYLASGRTDGCDCVDHFFEHLDRRLDPAARRSEPAEPPQAEDEGDDPPGGQDQHLL